MVADETKIRTASEARALVKGAGRVIVQARLGAGPAGAVAFFVVDEHEALAQLGMYQGPEPVWCEVIGSRIYLGRV